MNKLLFLSMTGLLALPLSLQGSAYKNSGAQSFSEIVKTRLSQSSATNAATPGYLQNYAHASEDATDSLAAIPKQQPLEAVLASLSRTARCPAGSVMTIVAHEDDDILFTSPDLPDAIQASQCVTTVYLTAGDGGASESYWRGREQGAEAAYSQMLGRPDDVWQQRDEPISGHAVTTAYLADVPQVALIFLRLPDGNLDGQGFASTQYASLQKLYDGSLATMQSIDGHAAYDKQGLVQTLQVLMNMYRPDQVRTLDYSEDLHDGDHSDHHAAGEFTKQAIKGYTGISTLRTYMGYPGSNLPANIPDEALAMKKAAFYAYGSHDPWTCDSEAMCGPGSPYHNFLLHQYSKLYP